MGKITINVCDVDNMLESSPVGVDFPVHNGSGKTSALGPVPPIMIGQGRIGFAGSVVYKFVPTEALHCISNRTNLGRVRSPMGIFPESAFPLSRTV